jgi:signal transduction histidine kinase/CheY-like chemotaxis protein
MSNASRLGSQEGDMDQALAGRGQTLRGKTLRLDLLSIFVVALILIPATWFLFTGFQTKFIELHTADASKVEVFIDSELTNAKAKLLIFASVHETERKQLALQMNETFSDIYRINQQGQIDTIYNTMSTSRVFEGFSFAAGEFWKQLIQTDGPITLSSLVRGYEDALPSVYIAYRSNHETILGRLNLDYIRKFLIQYSDITGNALLITTREGVVMVSGMPDLSIPSIDIAQWSSSSVGSKLLHTAQGKWIPFIMTSDLLGARLVVLTSTTLLNDQRNTLFLTLLLVLIALVVVVYIRSRQLKHDVLLPMNALLNRIRAMEAGNSIDSQHVLTEQLAELSELNQRFQSMTHAIAQREFALESANREIKFREFELRQILKNLPIPLIVFNKNPPFEVSFVNETFIELLGYRQEDFLNLEELLSRTCQDVRKAILFAKDLSNLIESEHTHTALSQTLEVTLACKSGVNHDIIVAAIRLEEAAIAALIDVSALRESERELMKSKIRAEQQEQQKTEFLATMSHEIRTPLTSIMGITQLLQKEPLSGRQTDMVTRLAKANQFLLLIINDILDHSKIEAGELSLEVIPFSLRELLQACQDRFGSMANEKAIELKIHLTSDCPDAYLGDPFRIEQILSNLVGNAIKFTEKGSVSVRVCAVSGSDEVNRLRFDIHDSGVGIPHEALSSIFTPFKQSGTGITRRFGGTGLGLSISKRLVDLMAGEIGVQSQLARGSHFWFELPLPLSNSESIFSGHDDQTNQIANSPQFQGATVLVVEDSPAVQFVVSEFLTALGAHVILAENGVSALARLSESVVPISAVLIDIQMPVMDGIECTKQIRRQAKYSQIPIIVMTAGILDGQKERILESGATDFLQKPVQMMSLVQCLSRHLSLSLQSQFPTIEGIDRSHALQTLNRNIDLFKRLLQVFVQETEAVVCAVRADLQHQNFELAARRMHNLRGSSSQLGALNISNLAREIEECIRALEPPPEHLLHELDQALKSLAASALEESGSDGVSLH